jgi:hypothetical protein
MLNHHLEQHVSALIKAIIRYYNLKTTGGKIFEIIQKFTEKHRHSHWRIAS